MNRGVVFALLMAFVGSSTTAVAQEDESRTRARELAEKAQDQLLNGDPKEALDLAQQAEAAHHAPTILLLIARTQMALGQHVQAIKTYDRIVNEKLTADARSEFKIAQELALRERGELYARVGLVEIEVVSLPSDATMTVAGETVTGPGPHAVAPGTVTVTASAPGHEPFSTEVALAAGRRQRVRIDLVRRGSSVDSAFDDLARTPVPTIISFSAAAAFGIAGAIIGGLALSRTSELDERCVEQRCLRSDRDLAKEAATLADASTGTLIAAAVLATGGAFFLAVSQGGTRWGETNADAPVNVEAGLGFVRLTGVF